MNHADALREMSVEKYMLGELTGASRDVFEEHLFECELCAADLRASILFAEGARQELAAWHAEKAEARERAGHWFSFLLRPQWTASALAACLLLIGYQNLVKLPALQTQLIRAQSPHVLQDLVFSSGAVRGEAPHVLAPADGTLLLSVDLPPQRMVYTTYVCSLFGPSGTQVWSEKVPAEPATEALQISVPVAATNAGKNTLVVQGERPGGISGATLEDLEKHDFVLERQK